MTGTETKPVTKTLELDYACEVLRPLARAERHYDTAGRKPNPFAGAIEKLGSLERERDRMASRAFVDNIERLVAEREQLRLKIVQLGAEHTRQRAELEAIERDETVIRFGKALPIAQRAGYGQTGTNYLNIWVLSNRSRSLRSVTESPVTEHLKNIGGAPGLPVWPAAILFEEDTERDKLRRWKALQRAVTDAESARGDALGQIQATERDHPELKAIP